MENTVGKGEIAYHEQFLLFYSVLKRPLLQSCKKPTRVMNAHHTIPGCRELEKKHSESIVGTGKEEGAQHFS